MCKSCAGLFGDNELPFVRRLALEQHVRKVLARDRKIYFSMFMPQFGLQTLSSIFRVPSLSAGGEVGFSGRRPDVMAVGSLEGQSDAAKKLMFFSVIDGVISRAKRTKVRGQKDLKGVASVCIHELLEFSEENKTCVASVSPISTHVCSDEGTELSVPMSLSVCSIASENLMSMWSWQEDQQQEDLVVRLSSAVPIRRAAPCCAALLSREPVLRLLLESTGGVAEGSPAQSSALRLLEEHGIVAGPPPFHLTLLGREMVISGVALKEGAKICRRLSPMEGSLMTEASTYQLMLELDHQGWDHEEAASTWSKTNAKVNPFLVNADVPDKVWYSKKNEPICRYYLLALLHAKPDVKVPHLASSGTYRGLLGIAKPIRKSKDTGLAGGHPSLPDDFDGSKTQKKKNLKKQPEGKPESSDESDDSNSDVSVGTDADGSNSDDGKSSKESNDGGQVPPDNSDDSSEDSSGSSSESSSGPASGEPDESEQMTGAYYGNHRLTKRLPNNKGVGGWEMRCNQDGHSQCSKTQTSSDSRGGDDGCVRRLKKWVLLAGTADNKEQHKDLWKQVEQLWQDGNLESMDALDCQAVTLARPQKKRRLE
jgi:hypothetical protein